MRSTGPAYAPRNAALRKAKGEKKANMAEEVGIRREDSSKALEHAKGLWQQITQYIYEIRTETKRVTWPGKQEIYGTTVMVILTTFLFGIYFYFCDLVFSHGVHTLLDHFLHRG
jgi:preprotein translocase subunit SecE